MATTPAAHTNKVDVGRLQSLFDRAVALAPSQRQTFIDRETEGDGELRQELITLLAHDIESGPLSRAIGAAYVDAAEGQRRARVGHIIGSYRLVSVLGQGGAGTVYLAERADRQYSAQVAVKIVDPTALQGSLGARFRAERQILASLNHPNIARLLDAGETEKAEPYLVMEYVHGETVDRYCDAHQLNLQERLALFAEICSAVQYAHQNLIVHRDLKPANILITGDGVPKLLDFGIAKLLDSGDVTEVAQLTRVHDRLLTPEYASPEQILGGSVTTASDVYSLGVVLYHLLCGLRPYNVAFSASQLELERSICVSDPDRPSVAVRRAMGSTEVSIDSIAKLRSTSTERLARLLAGDIDSIVMRALRKEPQHRYTSVEQFSADVHRHLANEPVQARQGTWLYYGQRFARRHVWGVTAGFGFFVFVIGVAIAMSVKNQQIAASLERAETVSEFMINAFSSADPIVHAGNEPTARNLLDQAARRIQVDLDQQPAVRARLLEVIGRSYRRLGQPGRAVPHLEESLRIQREIAVDGARLGSILTELAIAHREDGKYEESDRSFAEALRIVEQTRNERSEAHAQLLVDLGRLEMLRSETKQARGHFTAALEIMRGLRGPDDMEVGAILADLANVFVWENDLGRAEKAARDAVSIYANSPRAHPDRILADYRLAQILLYQNRLSEAAPLFERTLEAQRNLYGSNNTTVADTLGALAELRIAQENYADGELLIREALKIQRESGTTVDHQMGYLQSTLAIALLKQSRYAEAEEVLREILEIYARSLPPDHQYVASAEYYLGEALLGEGKFGDAEATLTASMDRWKRTDAPHWRSARSRSALGEALLHQGRHNEAEQHLAQSYKDLTADAGADEEAKRRARERLTQFYAGRGEHGKLNSILHAAK